MEALRECSVYTEYRTKRFSRISFREDPDKLTFETANLRDIERLRPPLMSPCEFSVAVARDTRRAALRHELN